MVIGAGMMARAITFNLAQREEIDEICLVDRKVKKAEQIANWLSDKRVIPMRLDVTAPRAVREAMRGCVAAISAVPYFLNLSLAQAAVASGTHFCDLGGNNRIVEKEFALDEQAKQARVTIIPDCGLAPGLVNILTAGAIAELTDVEIVKIRVGGLPRCPHPPLDYQVVFSAHGLINEYMEQATIIRDGKAVKRASLTEPEEISFPGYERLEAFHTSGGTSTLPQTMLGRVANLDYKTIRYPGHLEKISAMAKLGFFDTAPRLVNEVEVSPRELAVRLLSENLSFDEPDVVLLRVTANGSIDDQAVEVCYQIIDHFDEKTGLSAMMRTTGCPAAQVVFMLASGGIKECGTLTQETHVPHEEFVAGLRKFDIRVERTVTRQ
jgi:lysine 6-dehydrogenase